MNDQVYGRGQRIRGEVLDAAVAEPSTASLDDFSRALMDVASQYCWGEGWDTPGLDRKARSLTILGIVTALNRPLELKRRIRGAIDSGATKAEIQQVFLQSAFYCGISAAEDNFRLANEAFGELGI